MKCQSEDYDFIKDVVKDYKKKNFKFVNKYDYILTDIDIKSDNMSFASLIDLISLNPERMSKYIEKQYLNNKFVENRLFDLIYNLDSNYYEIDGSFSSYVKWLVYFENLPFYIYQKILYSQPKFMTCISKNTKNYKEIVEFHKFMTM